MMANFGLPAVSEVDVAFELPILARHNCCCSSTAACVCGSRALFESAFPTDAYVVVFSEEQGNCIPVFALFALLPPASAVTDASLGAALAVVSLFSVVGGVVDNWPNTKLTVVPLIDMTY